MKLDHPIYLDMAATTPLAKEAAAAAAPYVWQQFYNASASYGGGVAARYALDEARETLAACLGAAPEEVLFTSGGTESDNWAFAGVLEPLLAAAVAAAPAGAAGGWPAAAGERPQVVVSAIEHHAVGYAAERWGRLGCDVSVVGVDARGRVRLDELSQLLTPRTVLVSCMLANNEVGTVEPVAEVARLAHAAGALCHTDAVQAFGHIAVDVRALGVDLLSLSGHKFHGPKGVGALYVRRGVELASFIVGGGQERGRRAGTENVAGCVALATAARLSCGDVEATRAKLAETRDWFVAELARRAGGIELVGDAVERLPGNVNVCVEGVAGRALVMSLAGREVYASAGSACSAGAVKPSFVQLALGRTPTQAASAVRFSFDETTPRDDLETALDIITQEISRLRSLS